MSIIVTAMVGIWLFWTQYSHLSTLSWWYDNTQHSRIRTSGLAPDYDLATLPWQAARSRVFQFDRGGLTLVTGDEPFAYQIYATVNTAGAASADLQCEGELESGGVTIGLLQAGKWIAVSSFLRTGAFTDTNAALLGYGRSVTVVIANDNPRGRSRLTVRSLRLFFRK
jgi:hypothetical protein